MLLKPASALAILAVASQAVAELMPYKPVKMAMSVRDMFGVVRRDDSGYQPTQSFCGMGQTCAEACGAGFDMCPSNDQSIHCYDTTAQNCCPDGSGNSCDDGFYCTLDTSAQTWCCPEGLSLTECAAKYGVTGGLSSETPTPTSTSISSTSTSTTTSTTTSTSSISTSTSISISTSTIANSTTTTTSSTSSISSTISFVVKNTTTSSVHLTTSSSPVTTALTLPAIANTTSASLVYTPAPVTSTPPTVPTSGAMASAVPAALALLAAAAALL